MAFTALNACCAPPPATSIVPIGKVVLLDWVEKAFQGGGMGRLHLDQVTSRKLRNISSLAFGETDLRTVYLGCLRDDRLYRFRPR